MSERIVPNSNPGQGDQQPMDQIPLVIGPKTPELRQAIDTLVAKLDAIYEAKKFGNVRSRGTVLEAKDALPAIGTEKAKQFMNATRVLWEFVKDHPVSDEDKDKGWVSHKIDVSNGDRIVFTAQIERADDETSEALVLCLDEYPLPLKTGRSPLEATVDLRIYPDSGRWCDIRMISTIQNDAAGVIYIEKEIGEPIAIITADEMELYAAMLNVLHVALKPEIEAFKATVEE